MMVVSVENRIKLQAAFQSVLDRMDQAFVDRQRIDSIEEELFDDVRDLSRQMLQAAVDDVSREELQQSPDVIGRVDAPDLKRLDAMPTRRLVTLFGELAITGPVYAVRVKQKVEYAPVAERLGLPDGEFSYLFQNQAQRLCVRNAFHDSRDMLDELLNQRVSVRSLEHEVETRHHTGTQPVICLMDGEHALWNRKSELLGEEVIEILDFWHFLDRLRKVSKAFTTTDAQAEVFLEKRLRRVLEGDLGRVMGGLRQMLKHRRLKKADRETVESALTYFENNRERMRYDAYLAAGYPIASGVIEGSCRHSVEDRLDGTGMRWELPGAVAMLHTRSITLSDDWNDYQDWRIKAEQKRLYSPTAAT